MKLCALVIGHKESSPGAFNEDLGISEFVFNKDLAELIEKRVGGVTVVRVFRKFYIFLPSLINNMSPDFVISMHCNAFNKRTSGSEVLHYHKSTRGRKMAEVLQAEFVAALGLKNRGIISCTSEDRGGYLLMETRAPCVIAEPFFIDNNDDLRLALSLKDSLAQAYKNAIEYIAKEAI